MGIGLYGSSSNPAIQSSLRPAITWKSLVSQVRTVHANESVGYNRRFLAHENHEIATIPVGYADGFKRSLGRGKGGVVIHGRFCPTVGNVCMDMIMVDVTGLNVQTGDEVEIIGETQTLSALAHAMETIPYEVLTSISKRVQRVYVE
jgi:alanine racemase